MIILDSDHLSVIERRERSASGYLLDRLAEHLPSEVMFGRLKFWGDPGGAGRFRRGEAMP